MRTLSGIFIVILLACVTCKIQAHELSTSFVSAQVDESGKLSGHLKVKILDLKEAVSIDLNDNGELTWAELTSSQGLIEDYISRNFVFERNNTICPLQFDQQLRLQTESSSSYLILLFTAQCDTVSDLQLRYNLFFDLFANHKAIVSVTDQGQEYLDIVTSGKLPVSFNIKASSTISTFGAFLYQGIFHILIGLDHILFLITLLLTVSLHRENNEWRPIDRKSDIIKRTLWIVTSFTIAHSITLSGTALGWIPQFGPWIEVVIAASILFNVMNNLFPMVVKLSLITFSFGLIHGMGFAGALAELGLPENQKVLTVVAFNLGVEVGQLAILLVCLPFLIGARASRLYQTKIMPIISILIGLLAIYWIINRM